MTTNINIFGDAVSHGGLVNLYREAYEELEREFPHLSGHLALYFDNDPREMKEVIAGYFPDPAVHDQFITTIEQAMAGNNSSLVGTFAADNGDIEGGIVIRHVTDSFDPSKQEQLMWGRVYHRPGFPRPNPPLDYPEGFNFWLDFYHELGNHLHAMRNIERFKAGTVTSLEKEMFADTFATFAMYKRFGPEVFPFLKHFSNVRTLQVALYGNQQYYSSPAILEAMDRMMGKQGKFSRMSLKEMEEATVPIVAKTMKYHKDSKALSEGVEPLSDPTVQSVLLASVNHGMDLLRQMGLRNYAIKYRKAITDIFALSKGEAPYSAYELD